MTLGTQPNIQVFRVGRVNARGSASEVDMPTIRLGDADQMKKKTAVKLLRKRGRATTRPTNPEEGHMGATENQMVPTLPPLPDDDEPKQG